VTDKKCNRGQGFGLEVTVMYTFRESLKDTNALAASCGSTSEVIQICGSLECIGSRFEVCEKDVFIYFFASRGICAQLRMCGCLVEYGMLFGSTIFV
jgi:NH3-dependent NAD+ synthetase